MRRTQTYAGGCCKHITCSNCNVSRGGPNVSKGVGLWRAKPTNLAEYTGGIKHPFAEKVVPYSSVQCLYVHGRARLLVVQRGSLRRLGAGGT